MGSGDGELVDPDEGWVVTIPVNGPGVSASVTVETVLTSDSQARLREFGVERVIVAGEVDVDCTVIFERDAAGVDEVDRIVVLAGEVVSMLGEWLGWGGPVRAAGPVRATWCQATD